MTLNQNISTWRTPPLFQKGEFLYCQSWVILLSEDKSESAHGHYICVVPSIIRDEAAGNISSSIKFIYVDIYENQFDEVDGSIFWAEEGGHMLLRHGEAPSQLIAGGACSHPAQEPTCTSLWQQVSEDYFDFANVTFAHYGILWCHYLLYLCSSSAGLTIISSLSCCAGLKKSKHAMYQLILTFRLKASIFTACLSPDILGVNDKKWDGDSPQMWADEVINCDKW